VTPSGLEHISCDRANKVPASIHATRTDLILKEIFLAEVRKPRSYREGEEAQLTEQQATSFMRQVYPIRPETAVGT